MENNIQPIKNENKEYNHINQSINEVNKIINNNNEENNKKNKKKTICEFIKQYN